VVGIVKGRPDQVVHRRIDDHKVLPTGPFHVFDPGHQDAGVAHDEAAWLDQDAQAQRPQQRHERRGIAGRGENVFGARRLPPGRPAAVERRVIDDPQPAADTEKLERVLGRQLGDQRQHLPHRQLEWPDRGQLRTDVHLQAAQTQVS